MMRMAQVSASRSTSSHQANLRIIEAVAKYAGVPMDRVMDGAELAAT